MKLPKALLVFGVLASAVVAPVEAGTLGSTLTFSPILQTVNQGDQASVDIVVNGLGNGVSPALAAFDITMFFDSTILSPNTVTFSSRLGDPNDSLQSLNFNQYVFSGPTLTGVNLVNFSLLDPATLYALQTATTGFTLATITFDTIGSGISSLDFFVGSASDEDSNDLTPSMTLDTGLIEVNPAAPTVPEPATMALGGVGLLLAVLGRRYKRA